MTTPPWSKYAQFYAGYAHQIVVTRLLGIRFSRSKHNNARITMSIRNYPPPSPRGVRLHNSARYLGRITAIIAGFLFLGGALATRGQAQIIINVPLGQTLNYGNLPATSYVFQGAGRVNLNAANPAVTGSVTVEGVELRLDGYNSAALPNLSELKVKKGGWARFRWSTSVSRLSKGATISLDSGNLYFNGYFDGIDEVKEIKLSGGANRIETYEPWNEYNTYLSVFHLRKLTFESPQATVLFYRLYQDANSYGMPWEEGMRFKAYNAPQMVNSIFPNVVYHDVYDGQGGQPSFATIMNGFYLPSYPSNLGQGSWNSAALNIGIWGNQVLTANRSVNSLGFYSKDSVNLNGYTLSVNAGAFLLGSVIKEQRRIENGTITTAQPRYFFHIYNGLDGGGLSVSSNISGANKELVKSGPGELVFYGNQANSYTGTTYVHEGTLVLNKSPGAKAVGNIVVGDGGGTDILRLEMSHQIDDSATVTLKGGSRAKNMTGQGVLQFNRPGGVGLTEKIHTLQVDGQGVIDFAGGTLARPNVLETTQVLLPTADDTLFIRNWIEFSDYFLVSRAFAPNAAALARIWFEGWDPGAKLRDYNTSHWEIVPFAAPEPATYGALLGTLGIGAYLIRRRRSGKIAAQ